MWDATTGATAAAGELERLAPGRQPFIVPPASAKSGFFNNPITRQLWRTGAERLRRADRIVVIGYSLPSTDLGAVALLGEGQRSGGATVEVVNPDGLTVVRHLVEKAWVDRSLVRVAANTVEAYVDDLEREVARNAIETIRELSPDARVVVAGPGGGVARVVTGVGTLRSGALELVVGPDERIESLTFPQPSVTITELLQGFAASGAEALTVPAGTAFARVVGHHVRPRWINGAELAVLVPSASRPG